MKRFLKILLCVVLGVAAAAGAIACDGAASGKNTAGLTVRKNADGEYNLYRYGAEAGVNSLVIGTGTDYTLPSGEKVGITRILSGAFKGNDSIETLIVTSGVKEIEAGAFDGMTKLKTLILPFAGQSAEAESRSEAALVGSLFGSASYEGGVETVQNYGDPAGTDTSRTYYLPATLENVTVNYDATAYDGKAYELPDFAFYGIQTAKTIRVDGKVTRIGDYAFGNTRIESFEVPAAVKEIGDYAFATSATLTALSFEADSVLETVGDYAFMGTKCREIVLPDTVTTIGEGAFSSGTESASLLETITMKGVKTIGKYAFKDCARLSTVILGDDLEVIYVRAFMNCTSLYGLKLNDASTSYDLSSAVITAANSAEINAFDGCPIGE